MNDEQNLAPASKHGYLWRKLTRIEETLTNFYLLFLYHS